MLNWNVFDAVYLVFFAANFIIRLPHLKENRTTQTTRAKVDKVERLGLFFAFLGGMFLPLLYLFTPLFNFADYPVSPVAGWLGAAICIPSMWIFYKSHKDLGRQWSPKLELREEHQLIDHGVYQYIRHPMYTSVFLAALAQLLLLGNWLAGPSYLVGFGILYITRIGREETLMMDEFGEQYAAYRDRTNRLFSAGFLSAMFKAGR